MKVRHIIKVFFLLTTGLGGVHTGDDDGRQKVRIFLRISTNAKTHAFNTILNVVL